MAKTLLEKRNEVLKTEPEEEKQMCIRDSSNWTETDIWQYIRREKIEIPSLYFAKVRPVVYRDGNIIMVDDDRMKLRPGEKIEHKSVRFRTLGCYPLTGGCESTATTLDEIIDETLLSLIHIFLLPDTGERYLSTSLFVVEE